MVCRKPTSRSRRLCLRPGVAVLRMGDSLQLRAGDEQIHVLRSDPPELARRVLAMCDGRHDRASMMREIAEEDVAVVDELLAELETRGWLLPPIAEPTSETGAYLARFASESRDPTTTLQSARASVFGHEPSAEMLVELAAEHGIGTDRDASSASQVAICVAEQPDITMLFDVNDAACAASKPCLFVDLSHGTHATVGPFFVPGEGACYRCFRQRLHENTAAYAELVAAERHMLETREPLPSPGRLPAHRHIVLGIAASEVVAFFAQHRPLRTLGRALTIDLEGMQLWSEPVLRVPWCTSCGSKRPSELRP